MHDHLSIPLHTIINSVSSSASSLPSPFLLLSFHSYHFLHPSFVDSSITIFFDIVISNLLSYFFLNISPYLPIFLWRKLKKDRDDRITLLSYETSFPRSFEYKCIWLTFSTRIKRSNVSKNFTHFQSSKVIGMLMFIQFSYQKVARLFSFYILLSSKNKVSFLIQYNSIRLLVIPTSSYSRL